MSAVPPGMPIGVHRQAPRRDTDHQPFIAAALAFGVLGGFSLAFTLPLEAALGRVTVGWMTHTQLHGHIQTIGFATLFIIGVVLRLLPRFGGSELRGVRLQRPMLFALVTGVLLRVIGQPLASYPLFAGITVTGAAFELCGVVLFAYTACATLRSAIRTGAPTALLLAGAAAWLVVQSTLGLWWIGRMAADGREILGARESAVLVNIQFFGVLLGALLGVGSRSLPTFFGRTAVAATAGRIAALLLNVGLAAWVAGGYFDIPRCASAGAAAVGAAILIVAWSIGAWRFPGRLAEASKPLGWGLLPVGVTLGITGLALFATGVRGFGEGAAPSTAAVDSTRHLFALGGVTLGIVTMGQLILPEFASERFAGKPGAWRGPTLAALLVPAALLRAVPVAVGLSGEARWWLLTIAGGLGWAAITTFAVLMRRAARSHRRYLDKIASLQMG